MSREKTEIFESSDALADLKSFILTRIEALLFQTMGLIYARQGFEALEMLWHVFPMLPPRTDRTI